MDTKLPMFVVYECPSDYPSEYVVRKWNVVTGGKIEVEKDIVMRDKDMRVIAEVLLERGLTDLGPYGDDDPKIVAMFI